MCALEAKLFRREAELEVCLRDGVGAKSREGVGTKLQDGVPTPRPTHTESQAPLEMTDDEAIRMLELTATRNRALEVEIRDLFRRVSYTTFFRVTWSFFLFGFRVSLSFDCRVADSLSCHSFFCHIWRFFSAVPLRFASPWGTGLADLLVDGST
jgi:hypothetical protein